MIELLGTEPFTEDMTVLKQCSVGETYPLHTHTFYEYFLVSKGRALHMVNDAVQVVERGSLVFVRPWDRHCYSYYQSQDFEFYNVGFTQQQFSMVNQFYNGDLQQINEEPLPRHIKLEEDSIRKLEKDLLLLKHQKAGKQRDQLFLMLLSMAAYYILTTPREDKPSNIPDWLIAVLDQFDKPDNYVQGLKKLLEICHYSQEYINRSFQRYLRTTPTRYINEKRMAYAKKLLEETSLSVVEVCERSGFHSLSHFYTLYKELYGYTPRSTKNHD